MHPLLATAALTFFVTSSQAWAEPDSTKALRKFLATLKKARILQPPETPSGCLRWSVAQAGSDSLRFTAHHRNGKGCDHVADGIEWLAPRTGGEPVLVLGDTAILHLDLREADGYLSHEALHNTLVPSANAASRPAKGGTCRTHDTVERALRVYLGGFRYTYEKFLRADSTLGAWVYPKILISPSGKVSHAFITSSVTGSPVLDEALRLKAERMEFPAAPGCHTAYTFRLNLDKF